VHEPRREGKIRRIKKTAQNAHCIDRPREHFALIYGVIRDYGEMARVLVRVWRPYSAGRPDLWSG
jgi:hypothetical protein